MSIVWRTSRSWKRLTVLLAVKMDINKIQKLNQMAINLSKHNIVSKEEALAQAASIYGTEHNFSGDGDMNNDDNLSKDVRKLGFALERALSDISELKSQLSKLQTEVNDVRVNPTLRAKNHVEPVQRRLDKPIDRNNIAPEDVAIDKFFYFGEK